MKKSFPIDQNNLPYHPGPVSPPGGDGSPLDDLIDAVNWELPYSGLYKEKKIMSASPT